MADPDRARKVALAAAIAAAIAIPAEGLRQSAYRDTGSIVTICYGSTYGVKMGDRKTLSECKALLTKDMLAAVSAVERCAPGLPVNVLAAFSDAAYNIGPKVACNTAASTAARLLHAGDYAAACRQLPRWSRATIAGVSVELPGLVKRRQKEMALCLDGSYAQQPFLTNTPLGVVNAS